MDTQTLAAAVLEPLAVPTDRLFPISLKVYEGMVKHRLLTEDDKVELLDGMIVKKRHYVESTDLADRMYRFSLKVYEGMVKHRLLTEDDKVELLDGLLVKKMTKGTPHTTATTL